jgi:glycosyltransferase involved in cell wall biosynthesis
MKIVFPIVEARSGSDVYFYHLAASLAGVGVEARVLMVGHQVEFGVPLPRRMIADLAKADIIHAACEHGVIFAQPGIPLVLSLLHNVMDPLYQGYTGFAQKLFHYGVVNRRQARGLEQADRCLAISRFTRDSYLASYPGLRNKILQSEIPVIYPVVNTMSFRPMKRPPESGPRQLLFVGHWTRRKGADLLGPIMDLLGPGYQLTCAGLRGDAGRYGKWLRPNMNCLPVLNHQELVALYGRSDLLLFPSRLEGFGYVVAEAMASGLPIVATRGSALPELVEEGRGGGLCAMDDVRAFADAVRRILETPGEAAKMGAFIRNKAKTSFRSDAMVEKITGLYRAVLR